MTPDRLLFATRSGNRLELRIYDRSGRLITPATTLDIIPETLSIRLSALWDGRRFLVTKYVFNESLKSIVLDANGNPLSGWFTSIAGFSPALASNGTAQLLYWSAGDVFAMPLRGLDELPAAPRPIAPFALSGRPQKDVRIAWTRGRSMTVWRDERAHEIWAALGGAEIAVDRVAEHIFVGIPSVAAGEDRFLIAWYEEDAVTTRMRARRYSLSGMPIDAEPFTISSSEMSKRSLDNAPGVIADGGAFVVAEDRPLRLLSIDGQTGFVSELWRHEDQSDVGWGSLRPMKTASEWIVPYCSYYGFFSPHVDITWRISLLHMPLSGGGEQIVRTSITTGTDNCGRPGIAQAGDRYAVVGFALTFAGGSVQSLVPIIEALNAGFADIAWNGSEYVVVWTVLRGGPIRGMRFDLEGRPLDLGPFELAPSGSNSSSRPSIAVTDDGVIIAYTRAAVENGGAPRAFTRTLARLPAAPPRRPAVEH